MAYREIKSATGLQGVNSAQRLFVIPCGKGVSCLGFDVAHRQTVDVAEWLKRPDLLPPPRKGTGKAWRAYRTAMKAGQAHYASTGNRCPAALTQQLIGKEHCRVEVVYPDGEKCRFTVGKSTGWFPIHLEIANSRSTGGGAAYVPQGSTVRVIR